MYTRTVNLNDNETLVKLDNETGELKPVPTKVNNVPAGKIIFEKDGIFKKDFTNSWEYLSRKLTATQYKVAHTLAMMSKINTNSLEPLNDDTTIPELMEILQLSKNVVRPILKRLWDLGVYGKFEVKDAGKPYTKYWIINPYLTFAGKIIDSDIASLFYNTHVARAFRDPNYGINS